jgi:putative addiction module killer protein
MVYYAFPMGYTTEVYQIRRSETFSNWLADLADGKARARIAQRIDRLAAGNPGDVKPVGSGVSELRIDYGPGYRVYFKRTDRVVYVLLCGGTKALRMQTLNVRSRWRTV